MACVQKTTDLEKEHVKLLCLLARRKTERETCKSPPPSSHFYHLLPFLLRDVQTLTSLDTKHRWTMKHLQLAPGQTIYTSSGFPSSHTRRGTQQGPAPQRPSVRPAGGGVSTRGDKHSDGCTVPEQENIPSFRGKARKDAMCCLMASGPLRRSFQSSLHTFCRTERPKIIARS